MTWELGFHDCLADPNVEELEMAQRKCLHHSHKSRSCVCNCSRSILSRDDDFFMDGEDIAMDETLGGRFS
eukprot:CAMPEP_0169178052 /NCGR_PEP_ID=MMETSP1015-20121227/66858_1 /TAXON_ID=342587 /ORGANISM="Karlodinium micrum, Strain CCMP2283" /LENGTH=69 /DNA_ID=CAMNT_0009252921 /DNA_START=242 /DNA_END=448 /DNA_ORIENTATION=+